MKRACLASVWFAASACVAACVAGPGGQLDADLLADADFDTFVSNVQPVLDERCANPTCHGSPERPLEIYAVQQHRADPAALHRNVPLTDDELVANYDRARVFIDAEEADRCWLVSKPLEPAAGGSDHVGGVQFEDTRDREYQAILNWILDGSNEEETP